MPIGAASVKTTVAASGVIAGRLTVTDGEAGATTRVERLPLKSLRKICTGERPPLAAGLSRALHKPGLNFDNHRNIGMRKPHPAQELQT